MTRVPCAYCGGENKYDPEKYDRCYKCSQEEQGKKLCPHCQENFYDPEQHEMCYPCWMERKKDDQDGDLEDIDVESVFPRTI